MFFRYIGVPCRAIRWVHLFLALTLVSGTAISGCTSIPVSPHETVSCGEEYTLARQDHEKQITFYFNRPSGEYTDCDVWLWYDGGTGRGYIFHECAYGAKAVINVPDTVTRVGFIVRTGCSDPGGTSWGTATKDATESDRFAELTGDETVYYLKAGDSLLYTSTDGGKTLETKKSITMGDMAGERTVRFVLSAPAKVAAADVTIRSEDGRALTVEAVDSSGGTLGTVTLAETLDITRAYTLEIAGMEPVIILPCTYFSTAEFEETYAYDGQLGVISGDGDLTFKLWAPTATEVVLNLYDDGATGSAVRNIGMKRGERGVWSYTTTEDLYGKYYTYSVTTVLGTREAVDPYARSAGVNGRRGMILAPGVTDPEGWDSDALRAPTLQNYTDAVIWEIQIRDFSNGISSSRYPGKYLAFTETGLRNSAGMPVGLDYLKTLGVTHVHLMPTFDFASVDEGQSGGYNWGYDPQNYNVPEGSYATDPTDGAVRVAECKRMVQALHEAGIGVVMDVVYNHTYDADSNLNKVVPYYYYRYGMDGRLSNGSGCGNETASERAMYRKYMVDSVVYWMTEYHIDGFRFDLMGLHDVDTMKAIEQAVHEINPQALIYGEGWTGGTSALPAAQMSTLANIRTVNADVQVNGVAMFNDILRDAIKGSTDGKDTGYATGAGTALMTRIKFGVCGGVSNFGFSGLSNAWTTYSPTNMINYASAHDNLALWDKICMAYGEDAATLEGRLARNRLSAAIVMTSLGVPFMQGGEEMLRSKRNADGSYNANSYNASDAVNNLAWELLTPDSPQTAMATYYQGLIAFRKSSSALRSPTAFDEDGNSLCAVVRESGALLAFALTTEQETLLIVYNAGENAVRIALPAGTWDLYIDGTRAGDTPLAQGISGEVEVAGVSCYVYRLSEGR